MQAGSHDLLGKDASKTAEVVMTIRKELHAGRHNSANRFRLLRTGFRRMYLSKKESVTGAVHFTPVTVTRGSQ